ncbi:DUF2207 domain-containing protein [Phycicoccus endophyticus]|uniref:DUF2207 domain-containing protein n=1 Tax=Phycicoccus endophyticus TaxID=1690220 RepID=A0A7G9R392_9MICO|nr:DUF2207 domain-containing protein [Phycicoccus endophyticus]NHI19811.1 DUF2207 domain-containing protein [Phycicoccus endophyticus]QNN50067.1 DUF2207 domain-containing protein [Phycicoccus endophyticus]GGL28429.1 hypothetical protein GCM10012283_08260 [Phycicoccus endophyticus]
MTAGGRRRSVAAGLAGLLGGLLLAGSVALPAAAATSADTLAGGTLVGGRLGAWGGSPGSVAAAEQADSLHVAVEAERDGSVVVTEDITWRFPEGEQRHGIYRNVRVRAGYQDSETRYRYYELSGVEVTSPTGAPTDITVEDNGADRRIRIGSPSETVSGTARYVVRFRLAHLVNDIGDGTAEVYYDVVSTANGVPQHDVRATVAGPVPVTRAACYYGEFGSTTACEASAGDPASYRVPDLEAREGASVVASFPRGAFGDLAPDLRTGSVSSDEGSPLSPEAARTLGLLTLGAGALVPLGAATAMGLLVWRRGRDEQYAGLTPGLTPGVDQRPVVVRGGDAPTVAVRFTPPDGVQPGMVGTVIDEEAGILDVTATIVDLAVRGHLQIGRDDSGHFRREDWVLTRTTPPARSAPLSPYEQLLHESLFAAGDTVALSSLKNRFRPTLDAVQHLMYDEVVERGWFRRSPQAQRSGWMALGTVVAGLGVLTGFFLVGPASGLFADAGLPANPGWVLAGGLVVGGLVTRALGRRMAARTAEGSAVLAQARGFERYLKTAEANQIRWEEAQDVFSRYLPYAIVFGVAERWAEVFEELAATAAAAGHTVLAPAWYSGAWSAAGFRDIASSMDSFSTLAAGTFVSTPGSSGSSGFSMGGGFSGGGGGGTSGGSW